MACATRPDTGCIERQRSPRQCPRWLGALEKTVAAQGVIDAAALGRRKSKWEDADRETEFDRFVVRRSPAGSE